MRSMTVKSTPALVLLAWTVDAGSVNIAVIVCVPSPNSVGVAVVEQVDCVPPKGTSVQVPNMSPVSPMKVIVPLGFDGVPVPAMVSVTVTVMVSA